MSNLTIYDKREFYKKKVEPLVNEITKLCVLEGLPIFIAAPVTNTEKETSYVYDGIFTGSMQINLTDDKLEDFIMVTRGAEVKSLVAINEFSKDAMNYIMDDSFIDEENIEEIKDPDSDESNIIMDSDI